MEKIILGEDCWIDSDSGNRFASNRNVLVVGAPGTGKTLRYVEPNLIATVESNAVVSITKRKLADEYIPLFESRGYSVMDLNLADPEKSLSGFDLLDFLRKSRNRERDITSLAESIVLAETRKARSSADPYWDQAAVSLLTAEIYYVLESNRTATWADVMDLNQKLVLDEMNSHVITNMDLMLEDCFKKDHPFWRYWGSFSRLPIRTAGCVYSTLTSALNSMFPDSLAILSRKRSRFSAQSLLKPKQILFITTNPSNLGQNRFISIFYNLLFRSLFELAEKETAYRLPTDLHIIADDFAAGGNMVPCFCEYISIFREKGIRVSILLQSESQLVQAYGEEGAITILNCFENYIYLGGLDLRTARNMSERLNLPLEDVLYIKENTEAVIRRGKKPKMIPVYDIFQDKTFLDLKERQYDRPRSDDKYP